MRRKHAACSRCCRVLFLCVLTTVLRCPDVLNTCYKLRNQNEPSLEVSEGYWDMKESVNRCEQQLLRVLGFDMDIRHPHSFLLHIVRELEGSANAASLPVPAD